MQGQVQGLPEENSDAKAGGQGRCVPLNIQELSKEGINK